MAKQPKDNSATSRNPLDPTPRSSDTMIKPNETGDQVLGKVQLLCDDERVVVFFRHDDSLYRRVVKIS